MKLQQFYPVFRLTAFLSFWFALIFLNVLYDGSERSIRIMFHLMLAWVAAEQMLPREGQ